MANFERIKEGLDVSSLLKVVKKMGESEPLGIIHLRMPVQEDSKECVDTASMKLFPEVVPYIFGLMSLVRGERLGSVILTNVGPGLSIKAHRDMEGMEKYYDRFHVVVQSNSGCSFCCGGDWVIMKAGEVWWFDHTKMHSVYNTGKTDRIHLIVDIRLRSL